LNDEGIVLDLTNYMLELDYNLRREKYLVNVDIRKRLLWVFESTTGQGNFATGSPDYASFKSDPVFDIKGIVITTSK
jgi:hypothetical protein